MGGRLSKTRAIMAMLDQSGPGPALNDDDCFVAIRVDHRRDVWVLFPVSALNGAGQIARIHDQFTGPRDLSRSERSARRYAFSLKGRATNEAMFSLCWREFVGLAALRCACADLMGIDVPAEFAA